MSVSEWFTVDGGYVLLDPGRHTPDGEPMRFACTAGDTDQGVMLTTDECIRLGVWLLKQAVGRIEDPQAAAMAMAVATVPDAPAPVAHCTSSTREPRCPGCAWCEPF